ncbi:hypothetical protein V8E54_005323 [Elaphomyces granulatus]|jgi:hypothetical protein
MSVEFLYQWKQILQNEQIALWDRSGEEEAANLALPSFKQCLFRLAEQGLGFKDGFRSYEFIFIRGRTFHAFQVFSHNTNGQAVAYNTPRNRIWTGDDVGIPRTLNTFLTDPEHVEKRAQLVLKTGLIPYLASKGGADAMASNSSGGTVQ